MALTSLDKENINRLLNMLHINDSNNNNYNNMLDVRSNYASYSKLELIAKQIEFLKKEAIEIINNHNLNEDLKNIRCNFRKVPGTYYYIYEKNNEKILSLISPNDNPPFEKFLLKTYYDFDYQFHVII